ncbi:MAG: helix-turn-helix domain-containing protein [Cyclobacteriaceae bacterium]|nr:helix-turn-helix domain-containing protein [Cyclobacteriaceae bacterium HetDA_MAG_MS6]
MSSYSRTIPQRIKEKRIEANLTQQRLAELTGVKRGVVNAYENGNNSPSLDWLSKFIVICNTTYDYVLDGGGEQDLAIIEEEAAPYGKYDILQLIDNLGDKIDEDLYEAIRLKSSKLIQQLNESQSKVIKLLEQQNQIVGFLKDKLDIDLGDSSDS